MSNLDALIVKLEPLRVASFLGFRASPKDGAFAKLFAWARPRGLLDDGQAHRLLGFNNPSFTGHGFLPMR